MEKNSYFEERKIDKMLTELKRCEAINDLFNVLEEGSQIILIGGALREAFKNNYTPRDVDIILNPYKESNIESMLRKANISFNKNRFGGYKVKLKKMIFDIWLMDNHLGFNLNIYEKRVENIKETTFLNYDSLVYDYTKKKLYKDYYEECNRRGIIDIIGEEEYVKKNPYPYTNIVRMLKIQKETRYELSERSLKYISSHYDEKRMYTLLMENYFRHYKEEMDKELKEYVLEFIKNL